MQFKFWIRQAQYDADDKSAFAHQSFAVEIHNPKNEKIYNETLTSDAYGGIAYSQTVLLALVDAGLPRDDAYRIVQRAAAAAWDDRASFRVTLEADPDVTGIELDALFEPSRFLANLGPLFDRVEKLPVEVVDG